jgi:hypothetical protein
MNLAALIGIDSCPIEGLIKKKPYYKKNSESIQINTDCLIWLHLVIEKKNLLTPKQEEILKMLLLGNKYRITINYLIYIIKLYICNLINKLKKSNSVV